ncbi:MAG: CvpA family protein [Solobacterium sp.]|nr:CvpA family protein [Solobacterium sp.]
MITINTGLFQPAYINIAVVILFVIFMVRGAKRGVLMQVLSAFGTVVSFLAAWRYCTFASGYYNLWPKSIVPMNEIPGVGDTVYSRLNNLIWFIVLFIVIRLVFIILEKLCSGLSGLPVLKEISGLLGGILGIVSATIWIMVICVVLNMPFFKNGKWVTDHSLIGTITNTVSKTVTEFAGPINASETIGELYQEVTEFGDQDKEAIGEWLSEHGIDPMDAQESGESAEPTENDVPTESAAPEEAPAEPASQEAVTENPDDPEAPKVQESETTE